MASSKQGGSGFNYRSSVNGRFMFETQAQSRNSDTWERERRQPQTPSAPPKKK